MAENFFDVAVIGSGPAGGSTALHCAKLGLSVCVIEEHPAVGEPVHCGECLSELAVDRVGLKLPDSVISKRVEGIRVIFPNGKNSIVREKGFVLEKHKFERFIVGEAQAAGAKIFLNTRAEQFVKDTEGWRIRTGGGTFLAKTIVDASGPASVFSQKTGINKKPETVIGVQVEMQGLHDQDIIDFFFSAKFAPHGYLWIIPKSGGRANVGVVTNDKGKAKAYLDGFIKETQLQDKPITKTFGGLIPESGPVAKTCGERFVLVGAAAGFTAPMFEGGTALSLMSGKLCAETIARAAKQNDFSEKAFAEYAQKWKKEFPNYGSIIGGKKSLYTFDEQKLNEMGNIMPENLTSLTFLDKVRVGLKLMANPKLPKLKTIRVFSALQYSRAKSYGW